jgi:tRNA (guanine37-N1)-methyltransferase
MACSIDILTIFPDMFRGVLAESITARALKAGIVDVELTNIRDFATDRHKSVDDRPYGGGPGMVFKPEPTFASVEKVLAQEKAAPGKTRRILLSPQGRRLDQALLRELSSASWLILLCGHYEGLDERIPEGLDFEEVSIGDYVLSGGEIPAMVLLDGLIRLLPGALGHPDSAQEESFENGLLDYPHYTRPAEFRGLKVPEVLLSGDHQKIAAWRQAQAMARTRERRGDLLSGLPGGGSPAGAELAV